jgi:RimJ/RimL family protein N-acetyltransferase
MSPGPLPHPAVHLRPVAPGDLETLYEHQADPEGCRMAAVHPRPRDVFFARWEGIFKDPGVVPRAIIAGGVLVGSISVFGRDGLDYVGYWIAREHWGKGFASAGLRLLLGEVARRPLYARVATHNAASLRVLNRCGFRELERRVSPGDERFVECEEATLRLS